MNKLFTYNIAFITCCISLTGMLCLSLAEMLSWPLFCIFVILHLGAYFLLFRDNTLPNSLFAFVVTAVFLLEGLRIYIQGREVIILALRDMILVLAVTRLVLKKTRREIYQIIGISLAECILATIFTTSPLFLVGLIGIICLIPVALYHLDREDFGIDKTSESLNWFHWPQVWSGMIIIGVLLFFIIPRPSSTIIKYGLTKRPRTGFSENINLSQSSEIKQDTSIIMRILWSQGKQPDFFYLAGARLEGISKHGFIKIGAGPSYIKYNRSFTDHLMIYPTDIGAKNIFFPYHFSDISPHNAQKEGTNYYWKVDAPLLYDVWVSRSPHQDDIPCSVDLPDELREVGSYGNSIAGIGNNSIKAQRLAGYLSHNYSYTLDALKIPENVSPIDWFVFQGKKGRCEHFASALVTMLRGANIPARLVTGFLVSEYNTNGNYYIVRSKDAHAWVEYWDNSWHMLDATPQSTLTSISMSNALDALRFTWIRWVIQYSLQDQVNFAGHMYSNAWNMKKTVPYVIYTCCAIIGAVLCIGGLTVYIRLKNETPYQKILRAFIRKGINLKTNDSHQAHLNEVQKQMPALSTDFTVFLSQYLEWRFGEKRSDILIKTSEMLDKIRAAKDG